MQLVVLPARCVAIVCAAILTAASADWVAIGRASASDFDAAKPDSLRPSGPAPDAPKRSQAGVVAREPSVPEQWRTGYEPAGFPLLAGNSDIGLEFAGSVGTLSRFGYGVVPYLWNMDLVLALSVKNGPNGKEIAQQSYQWNIDVPGLAGGRVRLNPQLRYYRTVNQLYFGLGNASSARPPAAASARYFEFDDRQASFRELTRVVLRGPFDVMVGTTYRYEDPHPYAGSRLETDANSGAVRGVRPLSLFTLAGGVVYDTRDSEVFPRRGGFHQIGLRATGRSAVRRSGPLRRCRRSNRHVRSRRPGCDVGVARCRRFGNRQRACV